MIQYKDECVALLLSFFMKLKCWGQVGVFLHLAFNTGISKLLTFSARGTFGKLWLKWKNKK